MQELGAFDFGAPAAAGTGSDSRPAPLAGLARAAAVPAVAPTTSTAPAGPAMRASPTMPGALDPGERPAVQALPDASAAVGTPQAAAAATTSTGPSGATRPALTAEQLRQALAKADPGTRQKLLRLIAGGRTVQQTAAVAPVDGAKRRSLVMQIDTAPEASPEVRQNPPPAVPTPRPSPESGATSSGFGAFSPAGTGTRGGTSAAATAGARSQGTRPPAQPARPSGQTLMQIDEHTELLDAVPPPASPAARKAELQAQLDQVPRAAATADTGRAEPLAHKVLFPAYDPARHGEDVHGQTRRRHEGPIEGHYPAPRQPFKPAYKHPDGRPMTAEENQVEEVLQTQRCEETLGVLARDGVNGLLLSPRDLDAAVAQGVISAGAASSLWKTWSALRPVIHVIEDDPPAPADAADAADTADTNAVGEAGAGAELKGASDAVAGMTGPAVPGQAEALSWSAEATAQEAPPPAPRPVPAPVAEAATARLETVPATPSAPVPVPLPMAALASEAAPSPALRSPRSASAPAPRLAAEPDLDSEPSTLPLARTPIQEAADPAQVAAPPSATWQEKTPGMRLRALLRLAAWLFVAYCVLVTSSRLAMLAWLRWGHVLGG